MKDGGGGKGRLRRKQDVQLTGEFIDDSSSLRGTPSMFEKLARPRYDGFSSISRRFTPRSPDRTRLNCRKRAENLRFFSSIKRLNMIIKLFGFAHMFIRPDINLKYSNGA